MDTSRRFFILASAVATTAPLAACSTTQEQAFEAQLAAVINEVQAGVKTACTAAGSIVPQAISVFNVLAALIPNAAVYTAGASVILQATQYIISQLCPAAGAPTAPAQLLDKSGKPIIIKTY
jgi:hypothetical protein